MRLVHVAGEALTRPTPVSNNTQQHRHRGPPFSFARGTGTLLASVLYIWRIYTNTRRCSNAEIGARGGMWGCYYQCNSHGAPHARAQLIAHRKVPKATPPCCDGSAVYRNAQDRKERKRTLRAGGRATEIRPSETPEHAPSPTR